jgi:hypothetical protein
MEGNRIMTKIYLHDTTVHGVTYRVFRTDRQFVETPDGNWHLYGDGSSRQTYRIVHDQSILLVAVWCGIPYIVMVGKVKLDGDYQTVTRVCYGTLNTLWRVTDAYLPHYPILVWDTGDPGTDQRLQDAHDDRRIARRAASRSLATLIDHHLTLLNFSFWMLMLFGVDRPLAAESPSTGA